MDTESHTHITMSSYSVNKILLPRVVMQSHTLTEDVVGWDFKLKGTRFGS